jgi:hypothetical protein
MIFSTLTRDTHLTVREVAKSLVRLSGIRSGFGISSDSASRAGGLPEFLLRARLNHEIHLSAAP